MSIAEVYEAAVRPLSTDDQLRLATLILNRLTSKPVALAVGEDYEWSDDDTSALTAMTFANADAADAEEAGDADAG